MTCCSTRTSNLVTALPAVIEARRSPLPVSEGGPPADYDLVADATADSAVSSLIELRRGQVPAQWPPNR